MRGCAVQRRIDIVSAGEQQTVAHLHGLRKLLCIHAHRQNNREQSRLLQAVQIPRQHPDALAPVVKQRQYAGNRSFVHSILTSADKKRRFPEKSPLIWFDYTATSVFRQAFPDQSKSQGIASLSTSVDFLSPVSAGMVRSSISWLIGPS